MLSKESKKEAARRFKELKPRAGIYAVRSKVSGSAWVGFSMSVESAKNSCWFQLRSGLHWEKSLQREWDSQGESAFEYEIVDRLDEGVHALEVYDQLKEKRTNWAARLKAQQLL